jgi:hypothetical protein
LNYDLAEVKDRYNEIVKEVNDLQMALDKVNLIATFNVDVDID